MPVMDDIREQTAKMKYMTPKEKWNYFWEYYRNATLIILGIVLLVIFFIYEMVTSKDTGFYALFLNSGCFEMSAVHNEEFAEYAGIDTDTYDVLMDTTITFNPNDFDENAYYSAMKVSALFAATEVDVFLSPENMYMYYSSNEPYYDLRTILPDDLYQKFEGDFFYIDRVALAEAETAPEEFNEDGSLVQFEDTTDHRDPSGMADPVPVGIYLTNNQKVMDMGCYPDGDIIFGIIANTTRPELALDFLRYITE